MHFNIVIIDNNKWMYVDMSLQIKTMVEFFGNNTASLVEYNIDLENTKESTMVFLGTQYINHKIPVGSIVTNFDNFLILRKIISPFLANNHEIWDYSKKNIDILKDENPKSYCSLFEFGYSKFLDFNIGYNEQDKDIDVLFLGNISERRSHVIDSLKRKGYVITVLYRKIGQDRSTYIKRAKICLSLYSSDVRVGVLASRMTPLLCNNSFVVAENCSDKYQNDRWGTYTKSVDYDSIVDTIVEYLKKPSDRKKFADKSYNLFKTTTPTLTKM
jgi:hypothetical protein